jgi:hypothetical protein
VTCGSEIELTDSWEVESDEHEVSFNEDLIQGPADDCAPAGILTGNPEAPVPKGGCLNVISFLTSRQSRMNFSWEESRCEFSCSK